MKRQGRVALSIALMLAGAAKSYGQSADEEELALAYGDKSFVSIATGSQTPITRAPSTATVITAEEIATKESAQTALDLVQALPMATTILTRVGSFRLRAVERAAVAIRCHHGIGLEAEAGVAPVEPRDVAQADGAHRVAMIRALERKKPRLRDATRASGIFVSQFRSHFQCRRAVVGEEDLAQLPRLDAPWPREPPGGPTSRITRISWRRSCRFD